MFYRYYVDPATIRHSLSNSSSSGSTGIEPPPVPTKSSLISGLIGATLNSRVQQKQQQQPNISVNRPGIGISNGSARFHIIFISGQRFALAPLINGPPGHSARRRRRWGAGRFCAWQQLEAREAWEHRLSRSLSLNLRSDVTLRSFRGHHGLRGNQNGNVHIHIRVVEAANFKSEVKIGL